MSKPARKIGVRVHVRLTQQQLDIARHYAGRHGFTVSEVLRRALSEFLETKSRKG